MRRLLDALLTTDRHRRARLSQSLMAMAMMSVGLVAAHYYVWIGAAPARPVQALSLAVLAGMAVGYVAVRSGWSQRFADPSLTVPQMLYALMLAALAYAVLGAGRGAVLPLVMVILMFGMFVVSPRQMLWVSLFGVACFGIAMLVMSARRPLAYPAEVEIGHFLMAATMIPSVSILAARLGQMRLRDSRQRKDLAGALARIRELATRDELTGLINRRHMRELMEQEHQRCIRSGHTFCLAVLDIDHFKTVNQVHGHAVGDAVLRSVAHEAMRRVRASDVFSRWGGDRFVLLLSDTRAPLARGGVDRVRAGIGAMSVAVSSGDLRITMSAGLAEHHAGETVDQTLDRADQALAEAKRHGRDRFMAAAG